MYAQSTSYVSRKKGQLLTLSSLSICPQSVRGFTSLFCHHADNPIGHLFLNFVNMFLISYTKKTELFRMLFRFSIYVFSKTAYVTQILIICCILSFFNAKKSCNFWNFSEIRRLLDIKTILLWIINVLKRFESRSATLLPCAEYDVMPAHTTKPRTIEL